MRDRPDLRSLPLPPQAAVRRHSGGDRLGPTDRDVDEAPAPEFISIPEWARRLGISAESAYKAARLGQIPGCFNIGRLYRVNWPVFVEATSWIRSGPSEAG